MEINRFYTQSINPLCDAYGTVLRSVAEPEPLFFAGAGATSKTKRQFRLRLRLHI